MVQRKMIERTPGLSLCSPLATNDGWVCLLYWARPACPKFLGVSMQNFIVEEGYEEQLLLSPALRYPEAFPTLTVCGLRSASQCLCLSSGSLAC